MKKLNKKGFTIIELVIVIAVIAILAGVMIPTFSGIVTKAKKSAAEQEAMAYYKEIYAIDWSDGKLDGLDDGKTIEIDGIVVRKVEGDLESSEKSLTEYVMYSYSEDTKRITFKFFEKEGYTVEYSYSDTDKDYKWNEPVETSTLKSNPFAEKSAS